MIIVYRFIDILKAKLGDNVWLFKCFFLTLVYTYIFFIYIFIVDTFLKIRSRGKSDLYASSSSGTAFILKN